MPHPARKGKMRERHTSFRSPLESLFIACIVPFSDLLSLHSIFGTPMNFSEDNFAILFKKYRLRSEIESLAQFGNLLAEEGYVYETSIFTRWQTGNRIPRDRNILLMILKIFMKRGGITMIREANKLLESAGQGYITDKEKTLCRL